MKYLRNNYLLILGLITSLIAISYIIIQFQIQVVPINAITKKAEYLDFYSKLGDAIGGFAGSLLSFASILFVLHMIKIQREEFRDQKKELFNQRKEFIENKIYKIIYKEYDRWNKICNKKSISIDKILIPYLPTSNSYEPEIVHTNYEKINREEVIELIEDYNKICFRLFSILFYDSEVNTEKITAFFDRLEFRNFLFTIGSLFETTRVYGIYDTVLCYNQKDKKDLRLKAEKEILKNKMYYIVRLNYKIFEYQLTEIPKDDELKNKAIYDTSNERLFAFYQIDEVENKVKKFHIEEENKPAANKGA